MKKTFSLILICSLVCGVLFHVGTNPSVAEASQTVESTVNGVTQEYEVQDPWEWDWSSWLETDAADNYDNPETLKNSIAKNYSYLIVYSKNSSTMNYLFLKEPAPIQFGTIYQYYQYQKTCSIIPKYQPNLFVSVSISEGTQTVTGVCGSEARPPFRSFDYTEEIIFDQANKNRCIIGTTYDLLAGCDHSSGNDCCSAVRAACPFENIEMPQPPEEITTDISVEMKATTVNVTIPLNVSCFINPNEEIMFTHSDLTVRNDSYVPIKLSLTNFISTDDTKTFLLPNGLQNSLSWNSLNMDESATYFSVGVRAKTSPAWTSVLSDEYAYAGTIEEKTPLGIIAAKESGQLELDAYFGKSHSSEQSLSLTMSFVAEIAVE